MSQLILLQLKMARDWTIEVAESSPEQLAVVKHEKFNNTIQWQTGHILTVADRMMFSLLGKSTVPSAFTKWFESNTKLDDWHEQPPDLDELIELLKEQQAKMLAIAPEQFEQQLDKPFFGFSTIGECAAFVAIHETLHVGKMEEMLRVMRT